MKDKSYLKTLLTENFLESFWYELEKLFEKKGKVTERDCQRVFVFCMRCFHPQFFSFMISDIPGVVSSVGYDIQIILPNGNIFLDLKTKRGKKENSQISLEKQVEIFDFIEYVFLVMDLERKILYTI